MQFKMFFFKYMFQDTFSFSRKLKRQIRDIGLPQYFKYRSLSPCNMALHEEKIKSRKWFISAIVLALISVRLVEKVWIETMDEYTPVYCCVIFNDYMV